MNTATLLGEVERLPEKDILALAGNLRLPEMRIDELREIIRELVEELGDELLDEHDRHGTIDILEGGNRLSLTEDIHCYDSPHGLRVTAATNKGYRSRNEDRIVINTRNEAYAVIDGMGGEGSGETAARLIASSIAMRPHDPRAAMHRAQKFFRRAGLAETSGACVNMVNFYVDHRRDARLFSHQAGNVSLFVLDGNDDLVFESDEETFVERLVRRKRITPDQALYHPKRNIVMNAVTSQPLDLHAPVGALRMEPGWKVLLASDAVKNNLTTSEVIDRIRGCSGSEIIRAIADELMPRMRDAEKIIAKSPDRATKGVYFDGRPSEPHSDNASIVAIELP